MALPTDDLEPYPPNRGRRVVRALLSVLAALLVLAGLAWGGLVLADAATSARERRAERERTDELACVRHPDPGDTRNLCLYPDRPDRQTDDHEAEVGGSVRVAGYTATLDEAFMHELVLDDQLALHVTVVNRDPEAQPAGPLDWKIETDDGQTVNPARNEREDALTSTELEQGETLTGTVVYDLPAGTYYVVYRPDALNRARGIWRITVEPA